MPTSEQIEAAAKAIHAASVQDGRYTFDWCNELQSYDRDYFRASARAALEAVEALEEVEWEYSRQNRYGHVCDADDSLEEARRRASGYPVGYKGGYQTVVRRRKAGPWEEVK